jgi:choline-sulfatase
MMTGRAPSRIGAWDNAAELPAEIPTFAHYLSAAGYRTALSGKMHFCGPDQLHGFHERLTTDFYPADFTWAPSWDEPGRLLDWYHTMDVVRQAGVCVRSANLDYDDEVTFAARRYLFDHARAGAESPFCLVVSYIHPHDPYLARPEHWDLYADEAIDPPATARADVAPDPHSERLHHVIGTDVYEPTPEEVRASRRAYYAATTYVDAQLGELCTTLEEAGLGEDTVVIFTADHGDMLGERGLWFKMNFFEHAARVPLVVHWPRAFPARAVDAAVSLVDLLPTLAEVAGDGAPPDYVTPLEGRSLLPALAAGEAHDEALGEYYGEGSVAPMFMIRRGRWKFVTTQGDPPQLYDLVLDPHERDNRAADPGCVELLAALLDEAAARWDSTALRERVLESQRRRHFLAPVQRTQGVTWDYQPFRPASEQYVRTHMDIHDIEQQSRFPRT